ncbi:DUF1080 domain-containing protein [Rhodopirellula sp. SWK7]|uniref:3-keto-disaccharide hydrolase n=1 Tax=Rhodopirellula sp. SWK7 TaxID=595460 RepID=UPI0002C0362C|nr:DUF1080 domain-containing protein [Rhodopirellula sp. SWK7]EMI46548.1 multi-domain protein [Rhodopirellula sp. SWK7]
MKTSVFAIVAVTLVLASANLSTAEEYLTGIDWLEPKIITPGKTDNDPPSDAVVLFGGAEDVAKWENGENWMTNDDVLISGKGMIRSKDTFGDCQIHVEWSAPTPPKGKSQGRGNSGIFLMGRYEMQVLDSYENKTYFDGQAGAIYKQTPPAVNAMRPPGEWNSYDIFWTAPRFDENGELSSPAYITATHNGVLILNHFELLGDTPFNRAPQYKAHGPKGPIAIQDHGNPVRFRNIWVREYQPAQAADETVSESETESAAASDSAE